MNNTSKGYRRVVFRLTAPDAAAVCVSGDFNNWDEHRHLLKRKPGGFWEKTVMLPPGRYEYKFRVDGSWQIDPANGLSCENIYGSRNSVIEVDAHTGVGQKTRPRL
ncbi:MAG: glycogen-binding domain-containing protein [Desulfobacteraceae bacterium]|nr:glycogen-binding domain-containing protein [Desulfobacteraceae bacterium]